MILHPFIVQHNFQPNGRLPNSKHSAVKRKSSTYNSKYDMDLDTPARIEPHGPAIIYGVESEEVEEINDAYNDMLEDLGLSKATEVGLFNFDIDVIITFREGTLVGILITQTCSSADHVSFNACLQ